MFQWQQVQGGEQHQRSINNMEKQWAGGLLHQVNRFFFGTSYYNLFVSPAKPERSPRWVSDVWWSSSHQLSGPLLGACQAGGVPVAQQPGQDPVHAVCALGPCQL